MRYFGESSVPGAPGNLMAGSPSFQIGPRSPFKGMSQEELNKLKEWDDRPGDLQKYYQQQNQPGPQLPFAGFPSAVGNMGGLFAQTMPLQGDTINMGPAQGDYSNMPVIPDEAGDQLDRDALMEQYRNRAFPQMHNNFISPQIMTQGIPPGFVGKQVS